MTSLFDLREYDLAAQIAFRAAMEDLLPIIAPALKAFRVVEVEAVPAAQVPIAQEGPLEIEPQHRETSIRFDAERVVAGHLDAVFEPLLEAAEELARARLEFMRQTLDTVTEATGQVSKGNGLTWDSVMDAAESMALKFDEAGEPTFGFWPPSPQQRYEQLPPRDAVQEERWQELMERKRKEARARERDRGLR
ncbi:MAG: hypothetical protein M3P40_04325 [Actinomycetota bacterium]|nr:hypothetical protein [Actinomycetota bacterium]